MSKITFQDCLNEAKELNESAQQDAKYFEAALTKLGVGYTTKSKW